MKKMFYWYDELDETIEVTNQPNETAVGDASAVVDATVVDTTNVDDAVADVNVDEMIENAKNKLGALKDTLSEDPSNILNNILADNKKTAPTNTQTSTIDNGFEIADFKNIGLNEDQQKAINTHIASLISKKDSEITNLSATVGKLNDALQIKTEDETSIVKKIEAAYKSNVASLVNQVQDFETIVTNLTEQIKIKDSIISKNADKEYLAQELEKNPHMADIVKTLKIQTKADYLKIKNPELEAREKLVFEDKQKQVKHVNSKNIMRTVNGIKNNIGADETTQEASNKFDYLARYMMPAK